MRRIAWVPAVLIAGSAVWFFMPERKSTPSRISPTPPAIGVLVPAPSNDRPAVRAPETADLKSNLSHPLAAAFGTAAVPPAREAAVLLEFFEFYRREFGSFPTGEDNAQMMNALRGRNPAGMPVFPLVHPRLESSGALLDAWGRPFVFHSIDAGYLEIRSTGPDREIFTPDDILVPVRPPDGRR